MERRLVVKKRVVLLPRKGRRRIKTPVLTISHKGNERKLMTEAQEKEVVGKEIVGRPPAATTKVVVARQEGGGSPAKPPPEATAKVVVPCQEGGGGPAKGRGTLGEEAVGSKDLTGAEAGVAAVVTTVVGGGVKVEEEEGGVSCINS